MSVNWEWKNVIGKVEVEQRLKDKELFKGEITLYSGNCLFVEILHLDDKGTYQFVGFANDIEHFKNMCGVSCKFKDNYYKDNYSKYKFVFFADMISSDKLISIIRVLIKAKMEFEVLPTNPLGQGKAFIN